ncbi:unnamed protein product [Ilex paraguariensis]|uniref:Clp R domain-containing protein n=1 Tax=Ilex paraguariensis TaxID=185542 RepID=A0ABC8T6E7_9AQUA
MPTSVSTARQCLTEEAVRALDDAVSVARRRSHAQTTSLHAVSALLAFPSSTLREACARSRSSAYSPRLQFRALELCVGVSLDRLPSSKTLDEPPISNSLMAAIKRSQANQRRHPETFHLYQQQLQNHNSSSSISTVKVELKHFILSILDDPIVSRVFGDAGFRSCDVKLAIVNPPPISRFSVSRYPPPLFLCNLSDDSELNRRGFNFPFAGFSGSETGDENCKRICEVLVNKKAKNPLLIGVCANDALNSFAQYIQKGKNGVLPAEIDGLIVVGIDNEILEYVGKGGSEEMMGLKFKEIHDMVEHCTGAGIVVNYGDLTILVDAGSVDAINYVVSQLNRLVKVHCEKLWLIGVAGSYQTYMKFLARFPSIEKDWDLQLLPITSQPSVGGLSSKSSLMGSFVPFGGFFPTPSEFKNLLNSTNQSATRCDLCNKHCEEEVSALLNGGSCGSVADQHSKSLSSWLLMPEHDTCKKVDLMEAKDDGTVLNARLTGLQMKWTNMCQRLHSARSFQEDTSQARSQFAGFEGAKFVGDKKEIGGTNSSLNENRCTNLSSCMPLDSQKISLLKQKTPIPIAFEAENVSFQSKIPVQDLKIQQPERESPWHPSQPLCTLSMVPGHTSPSYVTPVTTDLGLGTLYASTERELRKSVFQDHKDRLQYFSGTVSSEFNRSSENASIHRVQSSSYSGPQFRGQLDTKDLKYFWRVLAESVGWQDEAICTIGQTVSRCRAGHGRHGGSSQRGDIWLGFLGPDKVGKKKIAAALAEIIFGSKESLISVDLSSEVGIRHSNCVFDHHALNSNDIKFRGKTVVDYIAEELSRKRQSVVLLENIDKADFVVQNSLSEAARTGRFQDLHGREISINNVIFVNTTSIMKGSKNSLSGKETPEFSEERILGSKGLQMKILPSCVAGDAKRTSSSNVFIKPRKATPSSVSVNKRKLVDISDSTEQDKTFETKKWAHKTSKSWLDLNLPVKEMEEDDGYGNCDSDVSSDNSEGWLEDFLDQLDEKVVFKPFDFDALAEKVLKEISLSFQKTIGVDIQLAIDPEVIVQILAAAWLSDRKRAVEDWIEQVLCRGFVEAQQRYQLTAHSVLKLVTCEGLLLEEQAPGVCLPARMILN